MVDQKWQLVITSRFCKIVVLAKAMLMCMNPTVTVKGTQLASQYFTIQTKLDKRILNKKLELQMFASFTMQLFIIDNVYPSSLRLKLPEIPSVFRRDTMTLSILIGC